MRGQSHAQVNQADLSIDPIVFSKNGMNADLGDDVLLYGVLEKWWWR